LLKRWEILVVVGCDLRGSGFVSEPLGRLMISAGEWMQTAVKASKSAVPIDQTIFELGA
jgi:hypothetical protein